MFRILPVTEPVATLNDYLDIGGGAGLTAALRHGPDWVLAQVGKAGLRGRGGAGFPVAARWSAVRDATRATRYVVGSAAEGLKDRYILCRNPYQVLEGLAIAAMCLGASRAVIVIKRRFEREIAALLTAAGELAEAGLLGDVPVQLVFRSDEYLLDEEKAAIEVIETLAHVPEILRLGADEFRESPGTMVFTISGDVRRPGVAELPLGLPLRALIELVGGGVAPGRRVKAVFPGGAPLTEDQLDTPLDFDSMRAAGSELGSAGFVVYDDSACIVAATLVFLAEPVDSITQCLQRIECGNGSTRDLDILRTKCHTREAALVRGALTTFGTEFEAHLGRKCPLPRELPVPPDWSLSA